MVEASADSSRGSSSEATCTPPTPSSLSGSGVQHRAFGFYAVPNAVILYSLGFLFLPKLVQLAHRHGYVTLTDFVQHRFDSRGLGLVITVTGLLATLPYLALQLIGLEVIFSAMGIEAAEDASWFLKDLPLFIAFAVLAAYTYTSGIRAPALIAFVKDALTYVFVITAVIYIPIKLGGFSEIFSKAGEVLSERTGNPDVAGAVIAVDPSVYMTLALGSGMAFFLYPHAITGVFAARNAQTVRRNMAVLPIYTVLLGLVALLGFMALAAGIEPKDGNPQFAVPQLVQEMFPSWFVGVAFAAIAMSALVPAAIMAIGAGNLVSRKPGARVLPQGAERTRRDPAVEDRVGPREARRLVVRAVAGLPVRPELSAPRGIWMLQTLPAVIFGLFLKRYANKVGLIAGWVCGFTYGTVAAYGVESANSAHFGGSTAIPFFLTSPIYIAVSGLVINLVVTAIVCGAHNLLRDGTLAGSSDDVDELGSSVGDRVLQRHSPAIVLRGTATGPPSESPAGRLNRSVSSISPAPVRAVATSTARKGNHMSTSSTPTIDRHDEGPVRVLTIANEAKRNAFGGDMATLLYRLLAEADADPTVRAIVVTGAGTTSFSSGHDLAEVLENPETAGDPVANAAFTLPPLLGTPVIGAVNGNAYAAGFILALNCDLRIAGSNARFCAVGARIGLVPVGGQLSRLLQVVTYPSPSSCSRPPSRWAPRRPWRATSSQRCANRRRPSSAPSRWASSSPRCLRPWCGPPKPACVRRSPTAWTRGRRSNRSSPR